jgi:hypothetical protein
MTTQRLEQTAGGGRPMVGRWMVGFALVALLVAGWMTAPAPAQQAAAQPIVGRAITITGPVFDGTRYVNMPISVGAAAQPIVGRAITITGPVFDGTRYVNMPISVGAMRAGQGYAVTALVYDGTSYRSASVQVGGR